MSYLPAACPKCNSIILAPEQEAFVRCPGCVKNISTEDAIANLNDYCSVPANTMTMIEKCLVLEKKYGAEVSLPILGLLHEKYPQNEEILYLIVKMNEFQPYYVKEYLSSFKDVKKKVPFAEDFLTESMTVRNMEFAPMFEDYIENKLKPHRKSRYTELMRQLKESYTKRATGPSAITLLFMFYAVGAAMNLMGLIFFLFSDLPLFVYALVCLAILVTEMSLLFWHNRIFGNRIKSGDRERIFMMVYMSSIILLIGGVFIGGFVAI